MVFESLVVDLINKYLGNYVGKLDKSQLKIGILAGNVTLENLDIKENAFDQFDLPLKIVQGHIGKLTLKIPWKHIYSEPVIVELDGLYMLVIPNSGVQYNKDRERAFKLEEKLRELSRMEEARLKRNDQKKEADNKDSFGEKLSAQIVKNLQISVHNIHIRYEDSFNNPLRPFAVGITLAYLSFQTCDANGDRVVIKDDLSREFFKTVKLDGLALYWKSQPIFFNGMARTQMEVQLSDNYQLRYIHLKVAMKGAIICTDNKVLETHYLIQPISCSLMIHVHMRPELTKFTVPQLSCNLTMEQIGLGFTRSQYCDLATFLDSIDRIWARNRYLKFRPNVPLSGNIKTWWLFPYNVILEEKVRRRRRMWSWQYIHYHLGLCRTYTSLWEQKLMENNFSLDDQKTIQNCEEELDLLNITLCRQQAEMKTSGLISMYSDDFSESEYEIKF